MKPKTHIHSKLLLLPQLCYALSIKQPWAALIVHGLKSIEIRSWPASRRGLILIHASKTAEENPEPWKLLTTPELRATAELIGGVIGRVQLTDCITYSTREAFTADAARHRAGPEWFRPVRYGLVLAKPQRLAFVPWPGNTNFFAVNAVLKPLRKAKPKAKAKSRQYVVRLPEETP